MTGGITPLEGPSIMRSKSFRQSAIKILFVGALLTCLLRYEVVWAKGVSFDAQSQVTALSLSYLSSEEDSLHAEPNQMVPATDISIGGKDEACIGDVVELWAENASSSICYWWAQNGEIVGSSLGKRVRVKASGSADTEVTVTLRVVTIFPPKSQDVTKKVKFYSPAEFDADGTDIVVAGKEVDLRQFVRPRDAAIFWDNTTEHAGRNDFIVKAQKFGKHSVSVKLWRKQLTGPCYAEKAFTLICLPDPKVTVGVPTFPCANTPARVSFAFDLGDIRGDLGELSAYYDVQVSITDPKGDAVQLSNPSWAGRTYSGMVTPAEPGRYKVSATVKKKVSPGQSAGNPMQVDAVEFEAGDPQVTVFAEPTCLGAKDGRIALRVDGPNGQTFEYDVKGSGGVSVAHGYIGLGVKDYVVSAGDAGNYDIVVTSTPAGCQWRKQVAVPGLKKPEIVTESVRPTCVTANDGALLFGLPSYDGPAPVSVLLLPEGTPKPPMGGGDWKTLAVGPKLTVPGLASGKYALWARVPRKTGSNRYCEFDYGTQEVKAVQPLTASKPAVVKPEECDARGSIVIPKGALIGEVVGALSEYEVRCELTRGGSPIPVKTVKGQRPEDISFEFNDLVAGEYRVLISYSSADEHPELGRSGGQGRNTCAIAPFSVTVAKGRAIKLILAVAKQPLVSPATGEIRARLTYEDGTALPASPVVSYSIDPQEGTGESDGQGGWLFKQLTPGEYTVKATFGTCLGTDKIRMNPLPSALKVDETVEKPTCDERTGAIALAVTGNTAPLTYKWYRGAVASGVLLESQHVEGNGERVKALEAGEYSVVVTEALTPDTRSVEKTFTIEPFATYRFAVTAGSACGESATGHVSVKIDREGQTPKDQIVCELKGDGDPAIEKRESFSGEEVRFADLPLGKYKLVVKDRTGCDVSEAQLPEAEVKARIREVEHVVEQPVCADDDVEGRRAGSGKFHYVDETGAAIKYELTGSGVTPQMHDGAEWSVELKPGEYKLLVMDEARACTLERKVKIEAIPSYELTIEAESEGCGSNFRYKRLEAKSRMGAGVTYRWIMPNGSSSEGVSLNTPEVGLYKVQLIHGSCKSKMVERYLAPFSPIGIDITAKQFTGVGSDLRADVQLQLTNGTPFVDAHKSFYKYYVVPNESSEPFNSVRATHEIPAAGGTVSVREGVTKLFVCDKNLCHNAKVLIAGKFRGSVQLDEPEWYNPTCSDSKDGMILVRLPENVDRTDMVYILEIRNGSNWNFTNSNGDGAFYKLQTGHYRVSVKDKNGVQSDYKEVHLQAPSEVTFTFTPHGVQPECPRGAYEGLDCRLSGGTQPYISAVWELGGRTYVTDFSEVINTQLPGAIPGLYTLRVVDKNGCEYSKQYNLLGPASYVPEVEVTKAKCSAYENGRVIIRKVIGGDPSTPKQLSWVTTPKDSDLKKGEPVKLGHGYPLPAGSWKIEVTQGQCRDTISVLVEAENPPLNLRFNDPVRKICYASRIERIELLANSTPLPSGTSIAWTAVHGYGRADSVRIDEKVLPVPEASAGGKTLYQCTQRITALTWLRASVKSLNGCVDTVSRVYEPYASLGFSLDRANSRAAVLGQEDDKIFVGVLSGVPAELTFTRAPLPGLEYVLSPEELFAQGSSPDNFILNFPANVAHNPKYSGTLVPRQSGKRTYTYLPTRVDLKNPETGCLEGVDLMVRSIDELRVPNVFTPNGDGKNDRWLQQGDPTYENVFTRLTDLLPYLEVEVFTRAGVAVWTAKGGKVAEGWDGSASRGGTPMPTGTYYYVIRFNVPNAGQAWKPIAGSVTIVR